MRKMLVLLLAILLLLSGCGETAKKSRNEVVEEAIEVLKDFWHDQYQDPDYMGDGYFEIKNTRVISIKENDVKEFKDVSCVVEFVLYTDYMGAGPYYFDGGTNNAVVVYQDGTMEVSHNPFLLYRSRTYNNDFSGFVDSIKDYYDQYNCVEDLSDD